MFVVFYTVNVFICIYDLSHILLSLTHLHLPGTTIDTGTRSVIPLHCQPTHSK